MKLLSLSFLLQLCWTFYRTKSDNECQALCESVLECDVWSWNGKKESISIENGCSVGKFCWEYHPNYGLCSLMQGYNYTFTEENGMITGQFN